MAPTGNVDPANVVVGTANAAGLYVAPLGTALPADALTALATDYEAVGYIAEDGQPTLSLSLSSEDIMTWQSITPVRRVLTEKIATIAATLVEVNPIAAALYFGEAVPTADTDGDFELEVSGTSAPAAQVIVLDILDGTKALRYVMPNGVLSEAGDSESGRSAAIGYPVTLTGLVDGSGNSLYVHTGTVGGTP